MQIKNVQIHDAHVAYYIEGSGSAVLLIHGTGGSAIGNWGGIIPALATRFHVIAPDYSGSGKTEDSGGTLTLEKLIEQHVAALKNEGLTSVHVVGYSLGAVIAAALAGKYPHYVQSLTLIGGWVESDLRAQFRFDFWQKLFHQDRELFAQFVMLTGFGSTFYNKFRDIQQLVHTIPDFAAGIELGLDRQAHLDARIKIRSLVTNISAPTQVVGLTEDQMVPIEYCKELAELIPTAQYREIESGHLVFAENPRKLLAVIEEFLLENDT
ncbi:Pimeloyl-ACP methyl ester carboxylesterase [Seinonella peptonophila]|uniref:Pimeloyl-ACP methyl ester carboxylesterase n=1 Tax=Seinonella peptonophila TaxID=112248 RepID=A0A1M4YEB6_9BACL|nr:alpha/beta hydrolase [Seinonella peptonophila]SHF03806.1 Pimeloyl-ACP methyl ester carboxylesterase [Seinonella peptonophila]